ncbi:spore cortex biosynthesis protein YabQ [Halobacillus salinarum]|uniref:Spore cortex biosynthesis protein YabQ n=1 Tax=Halobacillus salinarum TaxID=2932257 RepID=A0ABY4EJK7_9BACI|nr:spore cortex biosynthesis protein YabQ [Halobacillus salinarum]UOQ44664.1 spore cortex biosynthesis protein YabQ [Halobacillus salinarum]
MTLTTQFLTILSMLAGGVYVGASIDTFERLFYKRNKKSWLELFRQLFFWLFQSAIIFFFLYQANYGELRVYVFIALACGFSAYQALFKKMFVQLLEVVIRVVTAIIRGLITTVEKLIIFPIKTILLLIISLLFWVYKVLLKGIFIVLLVGFYPIKLIFKIIWRLLPQKWKIYLRKAAGFWMKIKNTMINWKKRIRK